MDMHRLRLANSFAMLFRKAFGEALPVSVLDDRTRAKALIDRASSAGDPKLSQAALDLARELGVEASIRPIAASGRAASKPSDARVDLPKG